MFGKSTNVPVTRESSTPSRSLSPWTGFGSLRDEMERLFDNFEPRLWFDRPLAESGQIFPLCPAIDLTESEKGYAITAELPGLEPDAIHVKISNGTLTISGEKSEEKTEGDASYHLSERRWGSFQRTIRMPENVEQDKIDAQFSKGVLTIHMPKSKAALASEKTIKVKAA
ncbi:Hsp20/alpha crystallin family protein [Roseovarius sp.]|uniref:Hsp20/alpha crystallin family protein n=1 Tax=Roseovarius sp. TaxID=1486281 RepID=UPI003A980369